MRTAMWLLVVVAIGAIAHAEPTTGTVVVSCNVADVSLVVDGVAIAERTPAVLTLPAGPHVIEALKPPLIAQKKVIDVIGQQQTKVRFELMPPAPPASAAPPATGSAAPPPTGSAPPPAIGSAAPPPSGSAPPPATGSGAPPRSPPSATGSGAPPATSSAVPPTSGSAVSTGGSGAPITAAQTSGSAPKATHCTEGGKPVPCLQGPRCTEGGKPVPCKKEQPPPPGAAPIGSAVAAAGSNAPPPGSGVAGSGSNAPPGPLHAASGVGTGPAGSGAADAGSNAPPGPPHTSSAAALEIATTVRGGVAYVDGAPVREAPCVLELEPGEHLIAVYAAGMISAEAIVRVEATGRQRIELIPTKSRKRIDVPAH